MLKYIISMKLDLYSYKKQPYSDWIRENPKGTPQEYLKEQLRLINSDLRLCNYIHYVLNRPSEEKINFLEKEKELILDEIHQAGWNEIKLENLNANKSLWAKEET